MKKFSAEMLPKIAGLGGALMVIITLGMATSLFAATDTWNGGGAPDGTWSNAANWGGTAPSVTGDNLLFAGGIDAFTTNNAVTSAGWIQFNTTVPFTNSGTGLTINGGYTNSAQNNQWSTALILGASQSFDVAAGTTNTITGGISGAGMALTKTSPGTLIFTAGNTYSGGTTVANGTLQISSGTGVGPANSAVSIATNANLNVLQGGNFAYAYSGSGNINIITAAGTSQGDNTTQLGTTAGLSGFTGFINVVPASNPGKGTTKFAEPGNLPSTVTIVLSTTNGEYFNNGGSSSPTFIAGSPTQGPFYAGAVFGRLRLNNNTVLSGPLYLNGNTSIGGNGGAGTYAGVISDGGQGYGIIVVDNNTLTVTAANTYTGYSSVTNGTLKIGATGSISNSAAILLDALGNLDVTLVPGGFWLNATQAISGIGTVKGSFNVPPTAHIYPGGNCAIAPGGLGTGPLGNLGTGIAGTLKFNNGLGLNGGSPITFDLADNVALPSDRITVTGGVTNNGDTTIMLKYLSPFPHAGTYTLMTYGSTNGAGTFVLGGANATNVTLNVGPTALTVTVTNIYPLTNVIWHGDGLANNWDTTSLNWLNGGSPATFPSGPGFAAVFDDSGSTTPAVNIAVNLTPGGVVMSNSASTYTFGGSGALTGNMALTLSGPGTLIINNSNSYTGGTFITSGVLQLGTNGSSGTVAGTILNNSQLIYNHSNTDVVSSVISGAGTVSVLGHGLEVFSPPMAYTGGTTISNGTLQLNNLVTGPITNNGTLNFNLVGSGQITANNAIYGTGVITGTVESGVTLGLSGTLVNFGGTINVPPSQGTAYKIVLGGGPGQFNVLSNTNTYALNIPNGATCLCQASLPPGMQVNIAGFGNGENLGALRLDNCATYGPVNLLGTAAIGAFPNPTASPYIGMIYDGIYDTNSAGVSQGYGMVIANGRIEIHNVPASYSGNTTVSNGILAVVNSAFTFSPVIAIASNAKLDLSGQTGILTPYGIPLDPSVLPGYIATQTLAGLGTNGLIVGSVTLNSGGSLAVSCSTNGIPSLVMSGAGILTINDNPVTVTVSGSPLPGGIYPLVAAAADGSAVVGSVANSPLMINGAGLQPGATASLSLSNSTIYLTVNAPVVFGGVVRLPDNNVQLSFSGPSGFGYSIHATTNLLVQPVSSWPVVGTGTFGADPVTFSDLNATNYPQQFYTITIP